MRIGSLFTGIGGLDWPWHGHDFRWLSENDKDARTVLDHRYPGIPNLGDITAVEWPKVEPIDVLIGGGFPCQPFSVAGRRKGKADDRYLWPFVADAIGVLGPRLVVLENVAGILGMPEWGAVVGSLADLGYDCRWTVVRASDIGAPHRRARVFVVAYPAGGEPFERSDWIGGWEREAIQAGMGHRRSPADAECANIERRRASFNLASSPSQVEGQGLQREWGGDAVEHRDPVTTDPSEIRRRPRTGPSPSGPGGVGRYGSGDDGGEAAANAGESNRADGRLWGGWPDGDQAPEPDRSGSWGPYASAVHRWERIHGPAPDPTDGRRLNPVFVEWMMGFPRGWVTDLAPRRAALRMLGNAVVPHQAVAALKVLPCH